MKFNTKYLVYAVYLVSFTTFVVSLTRFGYSLQDKMPIESQYPPLTTPLYEGTEGYPTPYPDPVFDANVPAIGLEATWHQKIKAPDLGLWTYRTPDPNAVSATEYYSLGKITSRGEFNDSEIYVVNLSCEGPCFYPLFYYFVKTKLGMVFLARNSDPLSYAPPSWNTNFTINTTHELSDLKKYPEQIFGKAYLAGNSLKQDTYAKYYVDGVKNLVKIATDTELGDIFTNTIYYGADLTGQELTRFINGLYFKAPDGTIRAYSIVPSFMKESLPEIKWQDGSMNKKDYTFNDIGGCGASNYASVIDESKVRNTDIVVAGKTSNGEDVYELKNPNHNILQNIYDNEYNQPYYDGLPAKKSYEEFIKSHPVFFWRDPFGRLIKFQNKDFIIQAECGKPVIYLYPEKKSEISVKVNPIGGFSKTEPIYPDDGWSVIADTNGKLTSLDDGQKYPYLFWEGRGGIFSESDTGFVVAREDVEQFLNEKLKLLGLNKTESKDFMEFWLPKMQNAPYYKITFLGNQVMDYLAPLDISPRPDSVIRILMDFKELAKPINIKPQIIRTPTRHGFTVVEWGGVIR